MGVFSYEDKIIIKYLRQKRGDGAKTIVKEHPEKQWTVSGVAKLLEKIDETGSVERKKGSGAPRTVFIL